MKTQELLTAIKREVSHYVHHNITTPVIVINPNVRSDLITLNFHKRQNELFGCELNISSNINKDEFIIGVKFKLEDIEE